ncbi:quinone oxidoreductase family protein [Streptomyces sp. NBC_01803]|uniref:quinone oxidoreductase family protein n=1 Tax=Streptomyces sp. NBC_01803 TaxID=2975946 RepID=UPI002DD8A2A2|nr:zinc-binding dehydrogenase [Streptomyces sp. NBC_01803]WSA46442.1 zinc-binding dehydrogenase [Streptomyces sp. NBC_01803]
MRAITMKEFGGPEVLQLTEVPDPQQRPAHHLIDVHRAGVNYADMHVRNNDYISPVELPYIPGNEVVGTAADGRRFVGLTRGGGYAEKALVHHRTAWAVPDDITDEQAITLALQGQSAWHLLFTSAELKSGQTVVIPAAAGGVGSLAVQLAKQAGAKVIALASTEEKRRLARDLGADAAVDSGSANLTEEITEGAGGPVHVALEMTGGPVLPAILGALAPHGRLVVYGYASGQMSDLPSRFLIEKSITVSGFGLPNLYSDRDALPTSIEALFGAVREGWLKPVTGGVYALGDASAAHSAMAARTHVGKLSLDATR